MTTEGTRNAAHRRVLLLCLCAMFTALTAVGAFIRIPIPHLPSPARERISLIYRLSSIKTTSRLFWMDSSWQENSCSVSMFSVKEICHMQPS